MEHERTVVRQIVTQPVDLTARRGGDEPADPGARRHPILAVAGLEEVIDVRAREAVARSIGREGVPIEAAEALGCAQPDEAVRNYG